METVKFTVWKSTQPGHLMAVKVGKHNITIGELEGQKAIELAVHLREVAKLINDYVGTYWGGIDNE